MGAEDIRPLLWQNDTSVSKNSWGNISHHDYKDPGDIIRDLTDVVSKNGALLLNIGPKADGTIPIEEQAILVEIGHWLEVNGEAIYGTRPWKQYGEGPTEVPEGSFTDTHHQAFTPADFRFTTRQNVLYATCLGWPGANGTALVRSLGQMPDGQAIKSVELLGYGKLDWELSSAGLKIQLPDQAPCRHAVVFKIIF